MISAGDKSPEFTLDSVDGRQLSLSDILSGGHNILLVFLRHLG